MNILFFDTETTGKAIFSLPADHKMQPRLVQLGAQLTDGAGNLLAEMNHIVKPDGWTIPEEAARIHGITTEKATDKGRPVADVLGYFMRLANLGGTVDLFVAHNSDFDTFIIKGECDRLRHAGMVNPFAGKKVHCTMKAATPLCELPGRYGYKWPTLQEAHRHFFGREFDSAHDAIADVAACREIYFAMKRLDEGGAPAELEAVR
jgi:DNA polymerase-3 subunit epsilon